MNGVTLIPWPPICVPEKTARRTLGFIEAETRPIAMAIGLVSASMNPKVLLAVFSGTQIGGQGISVTPFINALHLAFLVGVVASLLGAAASLMRGEHRSFEAGEEDRTALGSEGAR